MIRPARFIRHAVGLTLGLALAVPAVLPPALAQTLLPPPSTAQTLDPPGRVARLADASGQVWLYSPDAGEWLGAVRNQPLTSGDRLATDADGRAELRIGSTALRLDGGSELEIARLDDEHIALRLHAGSLTVRLRTADAVREFELATVEGRFVAHRPGRYRIDRTADRRGGGDGGTLTVYEGEAAYEGRGSALTVYPNQRADFRRDAGSNAVQYAITEAVADDFARWSGERDRDDDRAAAGSAFASRWVSPEMTGAEELDRNGRWEQDAEYGALWIPSAVPSGWAPYAAGRWAWVQPWGWTWVDDAPWGFAPFHYGRWLYRGSTWCWAPGSYVRRPVYAPALVVWLGGGGRPDRPADRPFDRREGRRPEPSIGWFPLAPREAYVPGYRVSPRYARDVNGGHVERLRADERRDPGPGAGGSGFRNRDVPNALTVLPESALLLQRPPGGVPTAPWRQARDGGRDDPQRDLRNGRGRDADPAAAPGTVIAAPPAPLPTTSPNRPAPRAEPGRPAWPRAGVAAGGGATGDEVLRRPAPGGLSSSPATTRLPAIGTNPSPPPAVPSVNRGLPAPSSNAALPSLPRDGGPVPPAAIGVPAPPTSISRNGELPSRRDGRADDAGSLRHTAPAATPVSPAAPSTPAAPAPPAITATPVTPATPALQGRPVPVPETTIDGRGRDGFTRREVPRADPSPSLDRRSEYPRPDRGEDRRGERADEQRRDGYPMHREEQRRPAPGAPAPAALPSPAAAPLTAPPVVLRPPAAAAPPAAPLQVPAPAVVQPPAAAVPAWRPPREAVVRPAPPAVAAPPPADDVRRAMPVNRGAAPDDARGPAPREQRQSR